MTKNLLVKSPLRHLYRIWWEKCYGVLPDDFFLVSYPRSGNTWLRFMLLQARPDFLTEDFARIEEIIPDMHGPFPWFGCRRASIVKSHLTYWQPFRRVIYLVRDGRAATYSNWKYQTDQGVFSGTFADFVHNGHWPSSWSAHVTGWVSARETKLVIRYEDLLAEPERELCRIAALLDWPLSLEEAREIARNSSKQRMRAMERDSKIQLHRVGPDQSSCEIAYTPEVDRQFAAQTSEIAQRYLSAHAS